MIGRVFIVVIDVVDPAAVRRLEAIDKGAKAPADDTDRDTKNTVNDP